MTDAELDRLEALFRNPPSSSGLAEHGLALIAELRKARVKAVVTFPIGETVLPGPIELSGNVDNVVVTGGAFVMPPEPPISAPTPPERPRSHKKGGK